MSCVLSSSGPLCVRLTRFAALCLVFAVCMAAVPARAEDPAWNAVITNHEAAPPDVVAVDKKRQQIFLFESRSPLRLKNTYICTTGQAPGDKMVRGDLKTPEGVYLPYFSEAMMKRSFNC